MEEENAEGDHYSDNMEMVDYVLNQQPTPQQHQHHPQPQSHLSLDKLISFADVMQFADFGPKLALSQYSRVSDDDDNDENYFLKFPVLGGGRLHGDDDLVHVMDPQQSLSSSLRPLPLEPPLPVLLGPNLQPAGGAATSNHGEGGSTTRITAAAGAAAEEAAARGHGRRLHEELLIDDTARGGTNSENISSSVLQQQPSHDHQLHSGRVFDVVVDRIYKRSSDPAESKSRRKRPRSMKTSEEVEIQRMTHIAVERNRRKQMNEHLRELRTLMPGSYVQRGDQASIIGGAIEFVRELEQLLQCLESQKRRRMFGGEALRPLQPAAADPQLPIQQSHQLPPPPPFFPPPRPPLPPPPPPPPGLFASGGGGDQMAKLLDYDSTGAGGAGALQGEETAESKSCLADVEVKLLGSDATLKILSRRRPGQLLKTIAALEDMPLHILHTNITTIEQTVLYSFNVKITGEPRFSAEDIANSVQQIFSFINASTT